MKCFLKFLVVIDNYRNLNKKQRNYRHQIKKINKIKYYCNLLGRHDKKKSKFMLNKIKDLNILSYQDAEEDVS
jgi:hypothetical protein